MVGGVSDRRPGDGLPNTVQDPAFAQAVADTHKEAASLLSATGAKVGFTNMQYIDPPEAYPVPPGVNGISEIWWEAYGPDAPPPNYQAPRPGQPFVGSKTKVDALNKVEADLARQRAITVFDLNKFADPKGVFTDTLKGKPARKMEVRVDLAADAAGPATFRVSYTVRGARWTPL